MARLRKHSDVFLWLLVLVLLVRPYIEGAYSPGGGGMEDPYTPSDGTWNLTGALSASSSIRTANTKGIGIGEAAEPRNTLVIHDCGDWRLQDDEPADCGQIYYADIYHMFVFEGEGSGQKGLACSGICGHDQDIVIQCKQATGLDCIWKDLNGTERARMDLDNGDLTTTGEMKIQVYSQAGEPTLHADEFFCIWKDTDDSDRIYFVFRRGSGDNVKMEMS